MCGGDVAVHLQGGLVVHVGLPVALHGLVGRRSPQQGLHPEGHQVQRPAYTMEPSQYKANSPRKLQQPGRLLGAHQLLKPVITGYMHSKYGRINWKIILLASYLTKHNQQAGLSQIVTRPRERQED